MAGRRRTGGQVAHAFLAIALSLPVGAAAGVIGSAFAEPAQSMLNRGLLVGIGLVVLVATVALSLHPSVRPVEIAAARALLAANLPDVPNPRAWDSRRRGAAWLALLVGGGLVLTVGLLYLLPVGVGLIAHPFSGQEQVGIPALGLDVRTGTGWPAAWVALLGVLALVLLAGLILGCGTLLARLAPRALGPTTRELITGRAERERELARANELARRVHDSLGHTLTAMTVQATAAQRLMATDPEAAAAALQAVTELGRRSQAEVDEVVGALRGDSRCDDAPGVEEEQDLVPALGRLLADAGLEAAVTAPALLPLPPPAYQAAFRVLREAVTNAARHGAGEAEVTITAHAHMLTVTVENTAAAASGAEGSRLRSGRGLAGLREETMLAGGELSTGEREGRWTLTARLPLR